MSSRNRRLALAAALAFLAGGSAGAAELAELRIGVQFGVGYLPIYVARDAGLFDKHMIAQGIKPVPVQVQNVTGGPQINDGLLSGTMEIGSGGLTAMMIAYEKTQPAGAKAMKGMTALSAVPYDLLTVNPAVQSIKDLSEKDRIGLTAVKVSIPAILLQMASEQVYGAGNHGKLDALTVSLAQPDGATSLLSGGGAVNGYIFAPPFNYQLRGKPGIRKVWTSYDVTGGPVTALTMWTTAGFRQDQPKAYQAAIAAVREAIDLIRADRKRAAEIFVKAENSKLSPEFVAEILGEPDLIYQIAPQNSMKLADFLARTGALKTKPQGWKDYWFPDIHGEPGS